MEKVFLKIFKGKRELPKTNRGFIPYESKLFMIFKLKRHLGRNTRNFRTGFTLVELLVVFFIMGTILAVILPDYLTYSTKVDLKNLALDVALVVREAQVYGGGAKVSSVATGNVFNISYGVHFEKGLNSFYLFENKSDGNGNENRYTSDDVIISTYNMKSGYSIYTLCNDEIIDSCANPTVSEGSLDIVFKRPNPDANIKTGTGSIVGGSAGNKSTGFIVLISPDQATTTVQVENTGSISIGN